MSNLEKIEHSSIPYSPDAQMLLSHIEDFPFEEFEKWLQKEKFIAGSSYIVEFLRTLVTPKNNV